MEQDGFTPAVIYDEPDFIYEPHEHKEINYLVCLEGGMKLTIGDKPVNFQPGDKLIIPSNTIHYGKVSGNGCKYFWSAK